jgi:hypothetical protein
MMTAQQAMHSSSEGKAAAKECSSADYQQTQAMAI